MTGRTSINTWAVPSSATAWPRWSQAPRAARASPTYAENIGVMAATKIYSTLIFVVAGLIAILLGFSPKFGALIQAIPLAVMGGVSIVVFGLIAVAGRQDLGRQQGGLQQQHQPHRRRRHAGAGHRRLHAQVWWIHAGRHWDRHVWGDSALRDFAQALVRSRKTRSRMLASRAVVPSRRLGLRMLRMHDCRLCPITRMRAWLALPWLR